MSFLDNLGTVQYFDFFLYLQIFSILIFPVSSQLKEAVSFLDNLGTVQYFDTDFLRDKVVVDPQWIVNVMACVVSVRASVIQVCTYVYMYCIQVYFHPM